MERSRPEPPCALGARLAPNRAEPVSATGARASSVRARARVRSPDSSSRRSRESVGYLLVNTPLTDPTAPYHSISYLVGTAAAAGFTGFKALDANVQALNFLASRERMEALLETCAARRAELERKPRLTRLDQAAYR